MPDGSISRKNVDTIGKTNRFVLNGFLILAVMKSTKIQEIRFLNGWINGGIKMSEEVKLSEEVVKQIGARENALRGANILFQMAKRENDLYVQEQLKALGLDLEKKYNIGPDGVVSEVKIEPVKKEGEEKEGSDVKIEPAE